MAVGAAEETMMIITIMRRKRKTKTMIDDPSRSRVCVSCIHAHMECCRIADATCFALVRRDSHLLNFSHRRRPTSMIRSTQGV
mmetsp:Transcript_7339/g.14361  ORF Transcript_7339/g.14361 Transcript_7339/m.14361 type:complete len:83 (+) Transcript_7339:201-449(+)